MATDLSRIRHHPMLDWSGVQLKQGGVLLDADANELVAVLDRRLRALASDVLGRGTVSQTTPDAFRVTAVAGGLRNLGQRNADLRRDFGNGLVFVGADRRVGDKLRSRRCIRRQRLAGQQAELLFESARFELQRADARMFLRSLAYERRQLVTDVRELAR